MNAIHPDVQILLSRAEPLILQDAAEALAIAQQAVALAHALGDLAGETAGVGLCGAALHFLSRFPESIEQYERALGMSRHGGDAVAGARALNGLGNAVKALGEFGESMEYYLESLRLAQEHGDELGSLRAQSNIGMLHWELGEYQLALEAHLHVAGAAARLGHDIIESSAVVNAAVDHYFLGHYEQALELSEAQLPVVRESGRRQHEVVLQVYRALSLLGLGKAQQALALARDIAPLAQEVQDQAYVVLNLITQGRALTELGEYEQAAGSLHSGLQLARAAGLRRHERDAYQALGELYAGRGDWQEAYRHQSAYHALDRTLHRLDVDHRIKVLTTQMQVELLRREAQAERTRNLQLASSNEALQELGDTQLALNEQLRRANEELDAFSYSISHDLRTPIRHISSFTGLLRKSLQGSENAQAERFLNVIEDSARRMNALVDALLSFARHAREPLHFGEVDLNDAVSQVRTDLAPDEHDRRVDWQLEPLPSVQGDATLLKQVLFNLLSNALTYTRPREEAIIRVWAEPGKAEWVIHVQDNGVGFDPQHAGKLFGVFQRLHRQEEFQGTGVGLANVQRIVARHGGRVWAHGQPGEGATFSFSLPVREADDAR